MKPLKVIGVHITRWKIESKEEYDLSLLADKSDVEFPYHPQSHKRIIEYQIPDWREAVSICIEASKLIPECKYIGFDLAQTIGGGL